MFRSALSHGASQIVKNNTVQSNNLADSFFLAFNDLNESKKENFDALPPLMTFQTNVGINLASNRGTGTTQTRSNACVLNANFCQPEQFVFNNEEQSLDLLNASSQDMPLGEVVYEKLPRWRRVYERTGRLNKVFQSNTTMKIKLNDLNRLGVNFVDSDKTRVNLTDSKNQFLFGKLLKSSKAATANKTPNMNKSKGPIEKSAESTNLGPKRLKIMIGPECLVDRKESNMHESKPKATNKLVVTPNNSNKSQNNNTNKPGKSTAATPLPQASTSNTQKPSNPNVKSKTPALLNKTKSSTLLVEAAAKGNQTLPVNAKFSKKSTSTVGLELVKTIKQENINSLDNSQNAESVSSCLLSSEMTSLERRLLGIDKAKTALTRPKTVSESSSQNTAKSVTVAVNEKVSNTSLSRIKQELAASKPIKASASVAPLPVLVNKPHDIKEELKKVVAKYRRPRVENEALNSLKKQETPIADLVVMKRKKCFWDPDSDTEYDRLINKKQNLAAKKQRIKGLTHLLLF